MFIKVFGRVLAAVALALTPALVGCTPKEDEGATTAPAEGTNPLEGLQNLPAQPEQQQQQQ